jgi:hypothetical protein
MEASIRATQMTFNKGQGNMKTARVQDTPNRIDPKK